MTVTINNIAQKVNVSNATVARVLNNSGYVKDETREKVLKVIKELNYTPSVIARSLSRSKTNTIGVIVPDINNLFFLDISKGITEIAGEHNLNIILCDTDEGRDKELKAFYEEKLNIPRDMSIIGFDKLDALNIIGMNISFINDPSIELGRIGMKMLLENSNSKKPTEIKRVTILTDIILKGLEKFIKKGLEKFIKK